MVYYALSSKRKTCHILHTVKLLCKGDVKCDMTMFTIHKFSLQELQNTYSGKRLTDRCAWKESMKETQKNVTELFNP